eukprot:jgi/Ulvmu1/5000/UM021_0017.1
MPELSDADSSATGPQVRAKAGSERRSSAAKVDASGPSMTGSNPSSETYQDGQGKLSKHSGSSKANRPKLPRPEGPPPQCPRCNADTINTKFCYYNNYNINQPRYYCKACQRHWTDGGTLRKVETGAGKRNSRRQRSHSAAGGDAVANSKAPKTRGGSLHPQPLSRGGAPATRRSSAAATVVSDMPSGPMMDSMLPDYNSSEAGASFQEGSSFNDKMLLDDECQAIADLDVIFENERLDAILGSSNTLPVENERPFQQMLGLDTLEDLPTMSQGDADFQQAMMDGYPSNPDAGQLLLSAGGMSTPGTSQGGPLLVADASGPLPPSFGDDETASPSPPSPKAVSHTGPPDGSAPARAHINVNAAFRSHINDPSPPPAHHTLQSMQHMLPGVMPVQPQPSAAAVPAGAGKQEWRDGEAPARERGADVTLATSGASASPRPADRTQQSSMPIPPAGYSVGLPQGQQWAVGSMPMHTQQYAVRPGMGGAPGGTVLVPASMQAASNGGMMAYSVNMGMHAARLMQARPQRMAPGNNGVFALQATGLQGYVGMCPSSGAPQGHMPAPQYYVMQYPPQGTAVPRACMPALASTAPQSNAPSAGAAAPASAASTPHAAHHGAAEPPQGSAAPGTPEAPQATANQMYAVDHNRQLMLRHQRMYNTSDPAAASGSPSAKAAMSAQRTFVPVAAHHLQGRIYVRPPEAGSGGAMHASPTAAHEQLAAVPQEGTMDAHAESRAQAAAPGAAPHGSAVAAATSASVSVSAAPSGSSSQSQLYATEYRQAGSAPSTMTAAQLQQSQGTAQHAQQLGGFQGPVLCMAPGQWQHGGRPVFALQPYYVQPGTYMNNGGHVYASAPSQQHMHAQRGAAGTKEGALAGSIALKEEATG